MSTKLTSTEGMVSAKVYVSGDELSHLMSGPQITVETDEYTLILDKHTVRLERPSGVELEVVPVGENNG